MCASTPAAWFACAALFASASCSTEITPARSSSARTAAARSVRHDGGASLAADADTNADASESTASAQGPLVWQAAADCPLARFEAQGIVRAGELWVLGGFTSADLAVTRRVHIYDPDHDRWREGLALPGAQTHFGIVDDDGDLLVFGGLTDGASAPTDAVFRLRNGSTDWLLESSLPSRRAAFAWAVLDRKLHLAGGLDADNQSDFASHIVRDLDRGVAWQDAAALPNPRNHGAGAASGGLFFAIAGRHGWDEQNGDTDSVHAYDPATDSWNERAPLPIARSEISAATFTTSDGRIIVIGGSVAGVHPSDAVYEYDPRLDRWRALAKLPEPRKGAVAARIGSRIVVTTGSPTSTDPAATTWVGCCIE